MSGIEIAGLVLGAIPLVISALEHYEDIIGPVKAFTKYRGELGHAIRELRNHHTSFEQSIEVLLRPITTDQELSAMIDNTDSDLWQDPDIDHQLKKSLGRAYAPYMENVNYVQKILTTIASKLENLKGVENIPRDGLNAIISQHPAAKVKGMLQRFEISKRLKFTMKKKKIKESMGELQKCIDMLDKFQDKADKISAADDTYNPTRGPLLSPNVETIRENAKRLYDVLSKTWCSTHSSHHAGLLLEQRLIRKPKKRGAVLQRKPLTMGHFDTNCFALSFLQSPASAPKKWLDAEIRIVEYRAPIQQSGSTIKTAVLAPPNTAIETTIVHSIPALSYNDPSQLQIITDICSILQSPCHPCIGFCLDSDGQLRGSYNAQRDIAYSEGETTLCDILAKHPRALGPQERYNLSITLTSSMLQLSNTPWLREGWSKADISFLSAKDGCSMSRPKFDIMRPYLTREHKKIATLARKNSGEPNDSSKVLALGIMLFEISYGIPIEELITPDDLGPNSQPTEISYLQVVRRYIMGKEGKGQFSFAFLNAISYCLQCFMNPGATLSDLTFFKTIEEQVLAPLEAEMDMLLFGPRM
ncbi:hypothetical protein TWF481_009452 [Arthrobotrys musiformis]|uniref:DUF7580 domain-containing protein n=1 Tax=Arthrobotrys musiformis TaxID=47236 RepID=A0AAV9W5Q6_9PEZI